MRLVCVAHLPRKQRLSAPPVLADRLPEDPTKVYLPLRLPCYHRASNGFQGPVRVARSPGVPTKTEPGEDTAEETDGKGTATLPALLVKTVPTSLVAGYTALIALVTATLVVPTATNPHPSQYLSLRWIAFFVLVAASAAGTSHHQAPPVRSPAGTTSRSPRRLGSRRVAPPPP